MAFRSSQSTQFSSTGTLTATAPAGVTSGDRLLALVTQDVNGVTFTEATGWVRIDTQQRNQASPDGHSHAIFEKKNATGSDSYNFTSDGTSAAIVSVYCFSGRSTTTAATLANTQDTVSNASPGSVALTGVTAASGDDILWVVALDNTGSNGAATYGTLTNYTKREEYAHSWSNAGGFTRDNVSSGATGTLTVTATYTNNSGWTGWVVAIPSSSGSIAPIAMHHFRQMMRG